MHKLSKLLMDTSFPSKQGDSIITTWLKEKANELNEEGASFDPYIILGLEPEKPKSETNPNHPGITCEEYEKPKEKTMEWCEHITPNPHDRKPGRSFFYQHTGVDDEVMFCPICGTPRPQKKSLEDRVSDIVAEYGMYIREQTYSQFHNQIPAKIGKKLDEVVKLVIQEIHFLWKE